LIAGTTGIVGQNLANHLLELGWQVHGISRRKSQTTHSNFKHLSVDLFNKEDCSKLKNLSSTVTHVFFTTWAKLSTEDEMCKANVEMLQNLLDPLTESSSKALKHVCLVTGTKNYLGPFEAYGTGKIITPFKESFPRLPVKNFYYSLEDELFKRAKQSGFTWSVARPHTIVGFATENLMNAGVSIAVYASICKYANLPFIYPGARGSYLGIMDVTDASLLAKHLVWNSTEPKAANQAFNVVNGDVFRWEQLWEYIAHYFDLKPAPFPGKATPLQAAMADKGPIWDKMVAEFKLKNFKLEQLAPWWHVDADLGRDFEAFNDMSKSRKLGFKEYQDTPDSLKNLFDYLRQNKFIPDKA